MTLATRCISCGTTFRVVQDQLRVSDGWVRCGRCDTVFDALDSLVDLESQAAPQAAPESAPIDIQRLLERQHHDAEAGIEATWQVEPPVAGPSQVEPNVADAPMSSSETDDVNAAEHGIATAMPPVAEQAASTAASGLQPEAAGSPLIAPAFMRDAEQEERWNSPAMRAALLGTSLILLIMLAMQVIYHQRDSIAARSTAAASLLHSACERWNCKIEPPRRVGDLSIESTALTKVSGKPHSVRLSMTLRNRGSIELAMPAVELSLTNAQGKLIARKALLPRDFQVDPPLVPAAGAMPLQLELTMTAGDARIASYTVELFYP